MFVDVLVCGGGLGGLALAAGLIRRGYDAHVFEAANSPRTDTATTVTLGGNAFEALSWLHPDIVPTLKSRSSLVTFAETWFRASSDQPVQNNVRPQPTELFCIRWSEIQRTLVGLVPDDNIHCNHKVTGYTEGQDCVTVHFKDQPDVRARLVVGADGVRSAIRSTMLPQDSGPRYLGHMSWNALLFDPDESVLGFPMKNRILLLRNGDLHSWKARAMVMDTGEGYVFWQLSVQADEPAFTNQPPGGQAADSTPVPSGVANAWPGLGRPGSKARIISLLKELDEEVYSKVLKAIEATPEEDIFERAIIGRVPLDELSGRMSSPGGRVVLLGDAAHGMHPGPGQGARLTFEDAHMLAAALEQHKPELHGWTVRPVKAAAAGDAAPGADITATAAQLGAVAVCVMVEDTLDKGAGRDAVALSTVVRQYEDARLARTCRLQRYANEGCGLPALRRSCRPADLSEEDAMSEETIFMRYAELQRWLNQYPDNQQGDPNSRFWKPRAAV